MARPRGPVEIKGVTTRHNESDTRTCEGCVHRIDVGVRYERVMRAEGNVESYHPVCFVEKFGTRELYGD